MANTHRSLVSRLRAWLLRVLPPPNWVKRGLHGELMVASSDGASAQPCPCQLADFAFRHLNVMQCKQTGSSWMDREDDGCFLEGCISLIYAPRPPTPVTRQICLLHSILFTDRCHSY
ncbi:hypothetical protein CONLIGDRAFT_629145 [Coniochaeta ligniaria NRRL 30616]|uniref:Uncharacterized protein n=1 Tax=Coniochaeta ligniaria NRRL 30616 TaxID=1408157 RepID=A0A1J7J422_9PEZI|nr:hypothetical protein CONLIGDRAFT_629145 [Coniochaeta ligniaria NRRL 30616]